MPRPSSCTLHTLGGIRHLGTVLCWSHEHRPSRSCGDPLPLTSTERQPVPGPGRERASAPQDRDLQDRAGQQGARSQRSNAAGSLLSLFTVYRATLPYPGVLTSYFRVRRPPPFLARRTKAKQKQRAALPKTPHRWVPSLFEPRASCSRCVSSAMLPR